MSLRAIDHEDNESTNATTINIENNRNISNEISERTWLNRFTACDQILSGSLLHLCYRIVDIILLLIGLFSSKSYCSLNDHLSVTAICLLIFYLIDIGIIFHSLIRTIIGLNRHLTDDERSERVRRISALRGFFIVLKLIPVWFGLSYTLSSKHAEVPGCELLRLCLGIVCFSTLLIVIIPPTKPEIPTRRSFLMECFIFLFLLIINGTYFGTVASAIKQTNSSLCIFQQLDDIYLRSPLKSYGEIGLIIFTSVTFIHLINVIVSQLSFRLRNGRQLYIYYYGFQYLFNYLFGIIIVYYLSIGAMLLFQPRSGEPCRNESNVLYKTLLIWQWLRILAPLLAVPLILILCCLGVVFGIVLSYCLPASITVPILELLRGWLSAAPVQINPNPPATQEGIDAIPVVLFGQEPDKFNQTECAICQTNFEANESLKKLQCGHLFHAGCVTNWLLITRICPICRQRMSSTN